MGSMAKRSWASLPTGVKILIMVAGAVELGLLAAAQTDIARRPAEQIRGSKLRWRLLSFINLVGPLIYFRRGRLPGASATSAT